MPATADEVFPIRSSADVVTVRQAVRAKAAAMGFSLVDQTKMVTAASEIARNTLDYGGGGTAAIEIVREGSRAGLRVTFEDRGPGIPDVGRALQDGFSSGSGLGLGGARRLVNDFDIQSALGEGTRVRIARWR
jgi:serine/threonine-protein kinase RsbT